MKMRKMVADNRFKGTYTVDAFGEIIRTQLEIAVSETKQRRVHSIDVEDLIYGPIQLKGTIGGRMF